MRIGGWSNEGANPSAHRLSIAKTIQLFHPQRTEMQQIRSHNISLQGKRVFLRPMNEDDWGVLEKWNKDPEVLYYCEGDDVEQYDSEEVKSIYRSVSQHAFCFIIELNNIPLGECWLQEMNLERISKQYPGKDCRRIDLTIGEKRYWGQGIGTEVINLLTTFGFKQAQADVIFACEVADYNYRSIKAFQKAGFVICQTMPQSPTDKASYRFDLAFTRDEWEDTLIAQREA
jgi:RimJ/RimL family protein N-acetyltransferase